MDISDWPSDEEIKLHTQRTRNRIIVIILLSFALIAGGVGYLVYELEKGLASGMCGNQVISREAQPDGNKEFVVFKRDCGATTGYSYQLSLIQKGEPIDNSAGNVYVSDQEIKAVWMDSETIHVIGVLSTNFKMVTEYKGIKVEYSSP
ncbi:hypothetical protein EJP77_18590 [Paenibacillus zeisoli]|uniref:DUF5412 domain-containing protein n=1 Tax=Paenibacillus zeisoli TaxID=2496267 RepID=A0A433X1M4_9BACL|nr:hypothetical protein [Paenibacillus zeisoli]RUT28025.1 hypothetical protein EJP77_18590 [Paenibacillus zeisoli]